MDLNHATTPLKALVSYALHDKHSITHLKISFSNLVKESIDNLVGRLFRVFSFGENRTYKCFISSQSLDERIIEKLQAEQETINQEQFKQNSYSNETIATQTGFCFETTGKDAFSSLRSSVTTVFRELSIKFPDIRSSILDEIWGNSYFLNENSNLYSKLDFFQDADPIVSAARINTLSISLRKYSSLESFPDKVLIKFEDALYLYHLALAVPTVENSYILLWTALESLMGLRTNEPDIITIKRNVSSALALGAVGRRVNATIQRMRLTSDANSWSNRYYPSNAHNADESNATGLCHWIEWITDKTLARTPSDPFQDMQNEPLLCIQYRSINENWKNLKDLYDITVYSKVNLEYQLDRLYQTRNRIVHSGRFGRAGEYLWVHLEWYVGKLLAAAILITDELSRELDADPRDIAFGCLRSQYESTIDYLDRHKDKKIEFSHILSSGMTRYPVLCF